MKVVVGDLLEVPSGIIVHQVNCRRVMGCGLAKQIRAKFPKHYQEYLQTEPQLGGILATEITSTLFVVGVYGQDWYGTGQRQTKFGMLRNGLLQVADLSKDKNLPGYLPYGLGCGLAGGHWPVVSVIIKAVLPDATVVRLGQTERG